MSGTLFIPETAYIFGFQGSYSLLADADVAAVHRPDGTGRLIKNRFGPERGLSSDEVTRLMRGDDRPLYLPAAAAQLGSLPVSIFVTEQMPEGVLALARPEETIEEIVRRAWATRLAVVLLHQMQRRAR